MDELVFFLRWVLHGHTRGVLLVIYNRPEHHAKIVMVISVIYVQSYFSFRRFLKGIDHSADYPFMTS